MNDYNGYNGLPGYNGRHLYNYGYDSGYRHGYNSPYGGYHIPHNTARYGFDQPLGGMNGYYAHPEETDVVSVTSRGTDPRRDATAASSLLSSPVHDDPRRTVVPQRVPRPWNATATAAATTTLTGRDKAFR